MGINLNSKRILRQHDTSPILDLIDKSLLAKSAAEPRREYVGASGIGGACEREIQFGFLGIPPDEKYSEDPRMIRIQQRGYVIEDLAIKWLEDAGFTFQPLAAGEQLRFHDADGQFSGGCDGKITAGPLDLPYPFLWEHKALGNKSYKYIASRGVVKAKPVYAGQMATYQAYLDLPAPALFQATNMDSMYIHFEWVDFNIPYAQELSDKAAAIILDSKAGHWRPRVSNDRNYMLCGWCKWQDTCHNMRG
jgi:hypothetical protein